MDISQILTDVVDELSDLRTMKGLFHQHRHGDPLPSGTVLSEIIEISRSILFPGFYGKSSFDSNTIKYNIGVNVERLCSMLTEQIAAGLCFGSEACDEHEEERSYCIRTQAREMAVKLISHLPAIRQTLATDVEAAYRGDPAAESFGEVISCYPIIKAISSYRLAHELLLMGVPLIPRIITEMAHNETGIDIHPAAQIGNYFTIDHGTGVVIGATCIIGNNVKLYQGVTLGAKSFPLDENGQPIKGIPRHPILEDDVIVYSNATILGRITIGRGATIGGNIWITESVDPGAHIVQGRRRNETDKVNTNTHKQ